MGVTFHAFKSAKEFEGMTFTLLSELPFWESKSQWTLEFSEGDYEGQNPLY
jgi:hypothetical protein